MKTKILSVLFFLAGIIFIFPQLRPDFLNNVASKALIMPLLMAVYLVNFGKMRSSTLWLMLLALIFAWIGDIALETNKNNEIMFMTGLAFFLLAQALYFTVFILTPGNGYSFRKMALLYLPVFIYGGVLLIFLYNDLGAMRIPVIAYSVVILAMLAGAISRIGKVGTVSFFLVLSGAVLFVVSDSMIAINKFSTPFAGASLLIMSTYMTGQFLIVAGFIRQFRNTFV
jgi:uncharacterized membrane protein YhhN